LLRWRREVEPRGASAFTGGAASEAEQLARQVAELERFCGQLALENSKGGLVRLTGHIQCVAVHDAGDE
jgi:hypothetical protein